MSKKRKTRKQKETAHIRHAEELRHIHIHTETPTYSVSGIKAKKEITEQPSQNREIDTYELKDIAYLKHDITAITAASGIIVAFDILLFVLLSTGFLRLHFLGY